jgi:acetate kinase
MPASGGRADADALRRALARMDGAEAIGHRSSTVGRASTGPVSLDDDVVKGLRALTPLAPLHQPAALSALEGGHRRPARPARCRVLRYGVSRRYPGRGGDLRAAARMA